MSAERVGIWGFGREGQAAWRYLSGHAPGTDFVVVDDDPARVHETAPDVEVADFDTLLSCATVWVSPGIRPVDPRRAALLDAGVRLCTGTDLFLHREARRTVGVTGTKGKSTTTTFVADLLAAGGRTVERGGNLGIPLLDLLDPATGAGRDPDALYAVELSSYQCASLQVSPRVAVMTQLYDDHLVEHGSRPEYWRAKSRIFACGAQTLVALPETLDKLRTVAAAAVDAVPDLVVPDELPALSVTLARHVADNLRVAVAGAGALLGAPVAAGVVDAVARAYAPLPHRQVVVSDALGVTWVDDALATTQESALAALDAFPHARVAILLGGKDRGQPVDALLPALVARGAVVLLVGDTAPRFGAELARAGGSGVPVDTVEAGVAWIAAHAGDLDVALLSPAAASYDQFRDHTHKGAAFATAVAGLPAVR